MNSLKTLLGATLLAALAYGVYVGISKKPAPTAQMQGPKISPDVSSQDSLPADALAKPSRLDPAAPLDETAPPFEPLPGYDSGAPETDVAAPAEESAIPHDGPPPPVLSGTTSYDSPDRSLPSATPSTEPGGNAEASATSEESYFQRAMVAIEQQLQAGQLAEAHLALTQFYGDPSLTPDERIRLSDLLSQLAGTVIYSQQHLLAAPYQAVAGDTLEQVATMCNVPWQLLAKINGLPDNGPLQPGQELKIVKGPFHAIVDLQERQLVLFLNGERYAGRFPIAIGTEHPPAPGQHYVVKNKLVNPTYYGADRVLTPEDPQNPLGTRKIELDQQLSIHGTNDPAGLDRDDPRGCIRLSARDVEDLYDILTVGSEISVRR